MLLLPPTTLPPNSAIERRHAPTGRYRNHRSCLRWEFGFSCAFCWLHETDLAPLGGEGLGLMWVEHKYPQSTSPGLADEYTSVFHACRRCNRARGMSPVEAPDGRRLLDACMIAWGDHFEARGDEMHPIAGDTDALLTYRVYDLDDPVKCRLRRERREAMERAWATVQACAMRYPRLLDAAERVKSAEDRAEILGAAALLRNLMGRARDEIARHRLVPLDAPVSCACGRDEACTPPEVIARSCRSDGA